jgi:hypothetical protein
MLDQQLQWELLKHATAAGTGGLDFQEQAADHGHTAAEQSEGALGLAALPGTSNLPQL